ncbi:MAG: hypothetical protein U1G08_15835 [Verrucomicrobiota bacterium]
MKPSPGRIASPSFLCLLILMATIAVTGGEPIKVEFEAPTADRWMYAYNATPGERPAAPVFTTFTESEDSDARVAQFLMGWETSSRITPGRPPSRYWIRSARLTLTTLRDRSFVYDPTADAFETALPAADPRAVPDADSGRPVELYGAGFRGGFTADTFRENSPFGSTVPGGRNAFAAGFNNARELVDVSNNVGKSREPLLPFPSPPFAIGAIPSVAPGEAVPAGTPVIFDLELGNPDVRGYLQEALSAGRLWFVASWLGRSAGQTGGFTYPDFATKENLLDPGPRLELDVVEIGDEDVDGDGLPDDWERLFLGGLGSSAGDDSDGDGMSNAAEWALGSNPGDGTSRVAIVALQRNPGGTVTLDLLDSGAGTLVIETSADFRTWTPVDGRFEFPKAAAGRWTSQAALDTETNFFRCRRGTTNPGKTGGI